MSRNAAPLDGDALMRAMNPSPEPPSAEAVEAALQRLLAEAEPPPATLAGRRRRTSSSPRRRLALAAGVVVAATAAVFGAINLLPASSPSAGVENAWAKNLIAHTANVAAGAGDGTLHINTFVTQTSANRSDDAVYTVESWAQLRAPYGYWETTHSGSDVSTTTVLGDQVESYDSRTNTLSGGRKRIAGEPRAALFDPAYHAVLTVLYPDAIRTSTAAQLPPTVSQLIARLIRSPHVRVDKNALLGGRRAIRITCLHGQAILYVQPHTYTPLEFVTTGDPGAKAASIVTLTMRFDAYETLSPGSVSPPNLRQLHPRATMDG